MQTIAIAGNITRDAEMRRAGDSDVCGFGVAVNYVKRGEKHVRFYDVSIFGKRGHALCEYLKKGDAVTVSGEFGADERDGKVYFTITADGIALQGGGGGTRDRDDRDDRGSRRDDDRGSSTRRDYQREDDRRDDRRRDRDRDDDRRPPPRDDNRRAEAPRGRDLI